MLFDLFDCIFRFINARRRIVQPMIDQSNRAGKLPINEHDQRQKSSSNCSPTVSKRSKHLNKSRELSFNDRKLSRRTKSVKTPVVSQPLSPPYMMKGKSV